MNAVTSSCNVRDHCVPMKSLLNCPNIDDGSMNQKERQKVVDKIKSDKNTRIILMSFKAGGVGESTPSGRCPVQADK